LDRAVANLPSREFGATAAFYRALGFEERWRDGSWMILTRGEMALEFFPHPELDPAESWFSCCLRLDDVDGFYETCRAAGVPERQAGWPRLQPVREQGGLRIGYLIDADGSLLRLIQNDD
jgi:catechol 2,3-dioxygenase-like lactoylglutathione lyase family enzyme